MLSSYTYRTPHFLGWPEEYVDPYTGFNYHTLSNPDHLAIQKFLAITCPCDHYNSSDLHASTIISIFIKVLIISTFLIYLYSNCTNLILNAFSLTVPSFWYIWPYNKHFQFPPLFKVASKSPGSHLDLLTNFFSNWIFCFWLITW